MAKVSYLPLLSDKQGELHALAKLSENVREGLLPLVRLRHPEPKPKRGWTPTGEVTKHLTDPDHGVLGCWGMEREILIDATTLDPTAFDWHVDPFDHAFSLCEEFGVRAVPATSRLANDEARSAAAAWAHRLGGRAAIRLRDHDITSGAAGLAPVLRELDLPRSAIDLIIDLRQIEDHGTFGVSSRVVECLRQFAPLASFRSLTVAAGSFPASLSTQMGYDERATFSRAEWSVWLQSQPGIDRAITYGDYGVVNALEGTLQHKGSANLRYTNGTQWTVLRGAHRDKAGAGENARLANLLVSLPEYAGPDHCEGCDTIHHHAALGGGGSSSDWRAAEFGHHITVVQEAIRARAA